MGDKENKSAFFEGLTKQNKKPMCDYSSTANAVPLPSQGKASLGKYDRRRTRCSYPKHLYNDTSSPALRELLLKEKPQEPFIFTRHPERSRLRRSRRIYCRKRRSYGCGRILPETGFRRFVSITNIYIVGADSISALLIEYFGSIWNAPLR